MSAHQDEDVYSTKTLFWQKLYWVEEKKRMKNESKHILDLKKTSKKPTQNTVITVTQEHSFSSDTTVVEKQNSADRHAVETTTSAPMLHAFVLKPSQQRQAHLHWLSVPTCVIHTWNTPLSPTCGVRYPCRGPVRPTGTPPGTGRPSPSLLHGFNRNAFHGPLGLSSPVTTAMQVTAPTHKPGATDAASLVAAALRNRAVRAAATGHTPLALCIPPAVWLEGWRGGGVGWV